MLVTASIEGAIVVARVVLQNTQARAELPAGSRRTIAASRIQLPVAVAFPWRAAGPGPDAVVDGPVRGSAAGYPHGRLQVVGELPVAGAFVARRLDSPRSCRR